MASPDATKVAKAIEDGFSKLAHATRRSKAMEIAVSLTEPGTPMVEVYRLADEIAVHMLGNAQHQADARAAERTPMPWETT